jgi:hypothetical protein
VVVAKDHDMFQMLPPAPRQDRRRTEDEGGGRRGPRPARDSATGRQRPASARRWILRSRRPSIGRTSQSGREEGRPNPTPWAGRGRERRGGVWTLHVPSPQASVPASRLAMPRVASTGTATTPGAGLEYESLPILTVNAAAGRGDWAPRESSARSSPHRDVVPAA